METSKNREHVHKMCVSIMKEQRRLEGVQNSSTKDVKTFKVN